MDDKTFWINQISLFVQYETRWLYSSSTSTNEVVV